MFPLAIKTGDTPPLAKFAAARLRHRRALCRRSGRAGAAAGDAAQGGGQRQFPGQHPAAAKRCRHHRWLDKVQNYHENSVPYRGPQGREVLAAGDRPDNQNYVATRQLSLLQGGRRAADAAACRQQGRPAPVRGGGHSAAAGFPCGGNRFAPLGAALLDERYGAQRKMYVRTAALVTNLAVHFKLGRERAMAWVTSLDKGKPVAGAQVQVSDCAGKPVAQGKPMPRACCACRNWPVKRRAAARVATVAPIL
jgi:hypothetical protein